MFGGRCGVAKGLKPTASTVSRVPAVLFFSRLSAQGFTFSPADDQSGTKKTGRKAGQVRPQTINTDIWASRNSVKVAPSEPHQI